ncbi:hypothetical protein M409DRAFT_28635 [Zasmidium cellare ATCC 36951]|uniref:Uncharacterized protein n=1 Tax=Zasmidium cellare ATCC 36951 TaxID=1080233 RepID=A0A6A6C411_ZASCE|nr:uncharacterized protein M409DRAFT_28635 [Zasmidium cellare ATCC 36951]KAF2161028.1 hypothetical protein M409DRAFT_28635 [Zasmidium cellare ATCC 36951]
MPPSDTLSGRINAATRKQHTRLNRLLMDRLPSALPPHTESPLLYSKGLVPFARIFILFEIEWELLTRHFHTKASTYSGHEYDVRQWLSNLRPSGLARSHRLRDDLRHLRMVAGPDIYNTPALGDAWVKDMRDLMRKKPHVFMAFAWVFYMAVFSGGRWIRRQLSNGGVDFWLSQPGALRPKSDLVVPGFSFLSFDSEHDGEDLKALFKTRLGDAERLLTMDEKQDVINVSQQLFDRCVLLVHELDRMAYRQKIRSWLPTILFAALLPLMLMLALGYLAGFSDFLSRLLSPLRRFRPRMEI